MLNLNVIKHCLHGSKLIFSPQFWVLLNILDGVFLFAAVHYRLLQRFVNNSLANGLSYNFKVYASHSAKKDLRWWANTDSSLPPRSLSPFTASLTLYSDASQDGWGGWTSNEQETSGPWSDVEQSFHINYLELKAVFFLFMCFFLQYL